MGFGGLFVGELYSIIFDPIAWFERVSTNKLDNANGIIVISESKNEGIIDKVADGLDRETKAVFQ